MSATGLTGLLTGIVLSFLYRRDRIKRQASGRRLLYSRVFPSIPQTALLLLMGAGFAQYMNLLINILAEYLPQSSYYGEMAAVISGKSLFSMIFWMGILAPFGEEMVFRLMLFLRLRDQMKLLPSALLSGVAFGVYHGNLIQGIYAGILGFLFALLMEWSGSLTSSFFLHAGANIWMLILEEYTYRLLLPPGDRLYLLLSSFMILSIFLGPWYFHRIYTQGDSHC